MAKSRWVETHLVQHNPCHARTTSYPQTIAAPLDSRRPSAPPPSKIQIWHHNNHRRFEQLSSGTNKQQLTVQRPPWQSVPNPITPNIQPAPDVPWATHPSHSSLPASRQRTRSEGHEVCRLPIRKSGSLPSHVRIESVFR
ncbi:hypothetical protein ACLOJK_027003, partial [Asimina triloba]